MGMKLKPDLRSMDIPMKDMSIGQFGIITDRESYYQGSIVFKSNCGQCSRLDEIGDNYSTLCPTLVRVLQPGEVLEITE